MHDHLFNWIALVIVGFVIAAAMVAGSEEIVRWWRHDR